MLSKKTRLCVRVLVAIASAPPGKPVTIHSLSKRLHTSVSYLESIARVLRETGLIRSARGPGGGYCLGCNADTTSIWDVVQWVDDTYQQALPASSTNPLIGSLEDAIRATFIEFLSSRTLGDFSEFDASLRTAPVSSRFRLNPMPRRARPLAPNSVFDLPSFLQVNAA